MRIRALVYLILLILMYIPYANTDLFKGLVLYSYWIVISLLTLALAWIETRRWSRS